MMRLILCALLLAPSAAMADPVSLFISAAAWQAGAITLTTFLIVTAANVIGSYQQSRAKKKARDAYNAGLTDRTTMIRTATEPRDLVLGRVRKSGVMYPIGQAGAKSEKMVFAILLAGHECDAIEEVWFNDSAVTLDGSGNVTSTDWAKTEKRSESTAVPQTVTTVTLPYDPVAGSVSVQRSTDWNLSNVSVSGRVVTWTRTYASPGYNANATTVFQIHYQRNVVTPKARVWWHLGTDGQAADARLMELFPALWTSAHRLAGITYAIAELDYDQDIFSAGIPNISFVMRGAKVYDPRTGSTAWSQNPALLLRHTALHTLGGRLPSAAGDHESLIAAANACDVSVTTSVTKDGTTTTTSGPRYVAGYVFKGGNRPKDALDELAEAMGGKWAVVGNQLVVKAGEYTAPLLSLGDNDFSDAGAVQVSPGRAREQLVNVITGNFSDKANGYKVVPFPRVASDPDIAADGAELPLDVEFAAVPDVAQAQHLSAIIIRDSRQALTVSASFKLGAYRAELFDAISLSSSVYGWSGKVFEVLSRSWSLDGLIRLTLKETAAAIYARDSAFEGVDVAPNTNLPDPRNVPTVTGLAATSGATQTPDGTLIPRVRVSWSAFADEAMSSGVVELRYWPASGSPDDAQTVEAPASALSALIDGLTGGAPVIITARARNGVPVRGDWCTQIVHTVASVSAPIASGGNLCPNADFANGLTGWTVTTNPFGATVGVNYPGWTLNGGVGDGSGTIYAQQANGTSTGYMEIMSDPVIVEGGKRYAVSAYSGAHRCAVSVFAYYYDVTGAAIGAYGFDSGSNPGTLNGGPAGGTELRSYQRHEHLATLPPEAASARIVLRKFATDAGQSDSYMFLTRAMFEQVGDTAVAAGPWSAPGASASLYSAIAASSAAAEAAASAYAAAQANAADVSARAYADGIVTAEEARAIADATAKANAARIAAEAAAAADATAKANVAATTANWDGVLGRPFDYSQGTDPASGGTVTNGSTWLNTSTGKSYLRVSGAWSAYVGSGAVGTAELEAESATTVLTTTVANQSIINSTGSAVTVCSITYTPAVNCALAVTVACVANQNAASGQWSTFGDLSEFNALSGTSANQMSRNPNSTIPGATSNVSRIANFAGVAGVAKTIYFVCAADGTTSTAGNSASVSNVYMRLEAIKR